MYRSKEENIQTGKKKNNFFIFYIFRGVCTQAPCYCIIMEYCPYGQLYEVLRDGKEIPPALVLEWAKQIASGMNYLHSHKIIHRDLKSPKLESFHYILSRVFKFSFHYFHKLSILCVDLLPNSTVLFSFYLSFVKVFLDKLCLELLFCVRV